MVAEHGDHRHVGLDDPTELSGQYVGFIGQAIVHQVAAQGDHVGALGHLGEERLQRALRRLGAVQVAYGRDTQQVSHQQG